MTGNGLGPTSSTAEPLRGSALAEPGEVSACVAIDSAHGAGLLMPPIKTLLLLS